MLTPCGCVAVPSSAHHIASRVVVMMEGRPEFVYHAGWIAGARPELVPPRIAMQTNVLFDGPSV
jgi:hypothetical protein